MASTKFRIQDFELWGGLYGEEDVIDRAEDFSITHAGVAYEQTPRARRLKYVPTFLRSKGIEGPVKRSLVAGNARPSGDVYEPLKDPWSIRVLELYGGEFGDELRGALHECSVEFDVYTNTLQPADDDNPGAADFVVSLQGGGSPVWYSALSYVWGNTGGNDHCHVVCNGHLLSTTPNLDCALRYLRLPNSSAMLWIDQICINQSDLEEKSRQVTLMQYVYRNARNTIAWIGEESTESRGAIETLRLVNTHLHTPNTSGDFRSAEDLSRMSLPEPSSARWRELRELFSKPCKSFFDP